MSARTELYRFVETGSVDPFSRNNNLFFILDKSGSMNEVAAGTRTRLDIARQQLTEVLDRLDGIRQERGITLHIGVCVFSSTSTDVIERRDAGTSDIDDIKAFLAGVVAAGNTPYDAPMAAAVEYFREPSSGFRRACFFITDGAPVPASTADTAALLAADMIRRRGEFSRDVDNDVNIYGVAVDLFDTVHLAKLDNTPRDGIQSISSTASQGLYNALLAEDFEERLVWNYTNAPYAVEYGGETYIPGAVSHSEVEAKQDIARANLDVTFDIDNPAARRWMKDSVEALVGLTVWELDEDDPEGLDASVIWKGRLSGVRPGGVSIKLAFDSVFTSLQRSGLAARYQRMCRHALYGRGCKVSKAAYTVVGIPSAVVGQLVTIPEAAGYPDGYFATGMIETPDGTLRFITSHVGSQITLMRPMESLGRLFAEQGYGLRYGEVYGGLSVKLYPGCDRSRGVCNGRFNNLENYGGFDWIPTRNPFGGSSIA